MNRPRTLVVLLALLACLLDTGCSRPQPPRVTPRTGRVTGIDTKGITLTVELDIFNPNRFPIQARSVSGELVLAGSVRAAQVHTTSGVRVPARSQAPATIEARFEWQNVAQVFPLAFATSPLPWAFNGRIGLGGDRLSVELPFRLEGEVTPEQLIRAGLAGFAR